MLRQRRAHLFEAVDVYWFEEPLLPRHYGTSFSWQNHQHPYCCSESLYSASHFREYLAMGAAASSSRRSACGRDIPWLKIAHLAETFKCQDRPFSDGATCQLAAAVLTRSMWNTSHYWHGHAVEIEVIDGTQSRIEPHNPSTRAYVGWTMPAAPSPGTRSDWRVEALVQNRDAWLILRRRCPVMSRQEWSRTSTPSTLSNNVRAFWPQHRSSIDWHLHQVHTWSTD